MTKFKLGDTEELEKVEPEMSQEYEVGKPYLWFGGECPVPDDTIVQVRFGDTYINKICEDWKQKAPANHFNWTHYGVGGGIVMFKVVEYPKQTRKVELELSGEEITTIKEVLGKVDL